MPTDLQKHDFKNTAYSAIGYNQDMVNSEVTLGIFLLWDGNYFVSKES